MSPLRQASQPEQDTGYIKQLDDDTAVADDTEVDEDVIHVDPPAHRSSKVGGGGYDPPTEDFGPEGGNTEEDGGWVVENGYGVPILASDEVAKNKDPSADYLQPAVSPEQERRGSDYHAGWDSEAPPSYQTGHRGSNTKSRPNSIGGEPLSRTRTWEAPSGSGVGTPLHEIEEYEPLFPEDDKEAPKPKALDQLRRPDLARHQFPSQDVWEDTPESLQYETTVDTPQIPEDLSASTTFEHPDKEAARKDGPLPSDRADFLSDEAQKMAKPHFKPGLMDEVRPHLSQRFPSQDIWEDTPDSLQYETTVDAPQMPEDLESSTGTLPPPEDDKAKAKFNPAVAEEQRRQRPGFNPRFPSQDIWEDSPDSLHLQTTVSGPQTPEEEIMSPESARSPPTAFDKPQLPARPARPSKLAEESKPIPSIPGRPPQRLRQVPPADAPVPQLPARPGQAGAKAPTIPERPKPQIPVRPARVVRTESQEAAGTGSPLSKSVSNVSAGSAEATGIKSPPEVKAKPAVPARPVNANFASLRAGFMNDLNSRLKIGPQAPKKDEEEEEETTESAKAAEVKAPLADARKGRARGPARRKPAAAATAVGSGAITAEQDEASNKSLSLALSATVTIWAIDDSGDVTIPELASTPFAPTGGLEAAKAEVDKIAKSNTDAAGPTSSSLTTADDVEASISRDLESTTDIVNAQADPVGAEGDAAEASKLSSATEDRAAAIQPGFEAALADSRAAEKGPATGTTDVASKMSEYTSEVPVEGGREGKEAATENEKSRALSEAPPTAEYAPPGSFPDDDEEPEVGAGRVSQPKMVDQQAQTGEKEITIRSPTGEKETMVVTDGGRPQSEGHVVVKDGEVQ